MCQENVVAAIVQRAAAEAAAARSSRQSSVDPARQPPQLPVSSLAEVPHGFAVFCSRRCVEWFSGGLSQTIAVATWLQWFGMVRSELALGVTLWSSDMLISGRGTFCQYFCVSLSTFSRLSNYVCLNEAMTLKRLAQHVIKLK